LWYSAERSPAPCKGADRKLAGIWDDSARGQVRQALGKGVSAAERELDAWTGDWISVHQAACESRQRGELSSELVDASMQCLDGQLEEARLVVLLLGAGGEVVGQRGAEVAATLPPPTLCKLIDPAQAHKRPDRTEHDAEAGKRIAEGNALYAEG